MEYEFFKNISIEEVNNQLMSFDSIGVIKFDTSTSVYQLITIKGKSKAISFDLDGNIQIGNNQPESIFTIKLGETE
jgi:hypothetical protein